MEWTDRIRQVKILLVIAAIVIAVASLITSHLLTRDLEREERARMEVWATAMRTLNTADENTNLGLVLKVINENNSAQSYRILLIDKPVEGKYRPVNASYAGITALHRKSIDGSG